MAQRVGLLNGTNITYDKDLTAGLLALVNGGVIDTGFGVSGSGASANILPGKALVECTRTNGEKVMVFFENTANVGVDLTGTKKVYIQINQGKLDNGSSNALDGTGIGAITTGASYPASNYIPLASITGGVITDERKFVTIKDGMLFGMANKPVDGTDANLFTQTGMYNCCYADTTKNNPVAGVLQFLVIASENKERVTQIAYTMGYGNTSDIQYVRTKNISSWSSWRKLDVPVPKFGGTGADGAIGAGNLTITGSNNTYIEKNYTSFAPGANTVTITPTNCILHIKVSGNCDLTNTVLNFAGKGGAGGNGASLPSSGNIGNSNAGISSGFGVVGGEGTSGVGGAGGEGGSRAVHSLASIAGLLGSRNIIVFTGGGGGGGGLGGNQGTGAGAGGAGGGAIIFEVAGNLTFSGGSCTVAGANGSNGGTGCGGGGGGGGGTALFIYGGTLSGSITPTVTGGTGGTGGSASGTFYGGGGGGGGGGFNTAGTSGNTGTISGTGASGGTGAVGVFAIIKNNFFL